MRLSSGGWCHCKQDLRRAVGQGVLRMIQRGSMEANKLEGTRMPLETRK